MSRQVFYDAKKGTFVDSFGLELPAREISSPTEARSGEVVALDDEGRLYAVTPLTGNLDVPVEVNSALRCPRCRQLIPLKALLQKFFEEERDPDELLAVFTFITRQIRSRLKESIRLISKVRSQAEVDPELRSAVQDLFEGVLRGSDEED